METIDKPILKGTLAVRELSGRYGPFKVGTLDTNIGNFAVNDPILDQYAPGSYEGEFMIDKIFQGHYIAGGRSITEIRAQLGHISIYEIDDEPPATLEIEQDPVDTEAKPEPKPKKQKPKQAPKQSAKRDDDAKHDDAKLFGLLWPLKPSFKLDPTVDRLIIRQQVARLQALGYDFDAKTQTWSNPKEAK